MRRLFASGRLLPIAALAGLAALVLLTPLGQHGLADAESTFCLGFILLFAFFVANILKKAKLPEISGYIVAGILCGPFILNILSTDVVRSLQLFDDVALSIIALIAGGEMRLAFLRRSKSVLAAVITGQILFAYFGAFVVVLLFRDQFEFLSGLGVGGVVALALVFGAATVARSPSTTIGVITEMRASGTYTNLVIGMTVILDVVVLVLVALMVPTIRALTVPGSEFSLLFAKDLFAELGGSIGSGIVFGGIAIVYMRWLGGRLPIFLVGLGFVGSIVCRRFHLEPLLAFMVAGFIVQNYTALGDKLILALERSALPVYVIFFAISGASINLSALAAMWPLALLLVVVRASAFYLGGAVPALLMRDARPYGHSLWLGLLSQAGVTIGIATTFERHFDWGGEVKTIILALVAINQLLGPIALRYILLRRGEASE